MIKSQALRKLKPLEFDPNKKKDNFGWATYVPGRTPEFKAHTQRGHAISALSQHQAGIIYILRNNLWVEIINLPSANPWGMNSQKPQLDCDACGKSTWQANNYHSFQPSNGWNYGKYVFDTKAQPIQVYWLCHDCRR